ncbi:MAG TPA: PQQ-binding-like beta-propeller repeat protein [Thermoanaerobaculia bacterium]|nr:PQQ-binding-like beta-propeller repeat protein [Thermoanaerobaculia bacterium]
MWRSFASRKSASAGVLLLTLICLPAVAQNITGANPVGRRRALVGPANDWTKYCGSLAMDGNADGERVLSPASVPGLQLLWSQKLNGPVASAPSVAYGKVYVGDWAGFEWALDSTSGNAVASADLGTTTSSNCNPATVGISSSPIIEGNVLYLAGGDDGFYALDVDTLKIIWRRSLGDNSAAGGYYGWCSPTIAGGKVLQGISSNCDNPFPRGALAALDRMTGEVLQTTYFVPEDLVGGGIWTSPAVDTDHRKIFVTTGSAHSFADGDAFSMVRLDLDTLLIEDRWKLPANPDETWDADWGSSPTLFTDAAGRELVGAGQKDGGYYAFDRNNLAAGPLWIAPIAIKGEVPQNGEGTLSTAAFDGTTLYVGGGHPPDSADDSVRGAVTAVSPDDGTILWRHTFAGPVIAPVSFANGVVFAVGGKSVVALDASNGAVLWSYEMKSLGFGGVAIARGRAFVGDLFGNVYAFGIR